jgi:hypothetical protein
LKADHENEEIEIIYRLLWSERRDLREERAVIGTDIESILYRTIYPVDKDMGYVWISCQQEIYPDRPKTRQGEKQEKQNMNMNIKR